LSEVDVSDLENLRVRVNDPAGDVLVHLGSSDYLKRYKIYVSHVQEWRQHFQKLESVNLRYDNQVIVNPDMEGRPKSAALTAAAAKAAVAAGVRPAALTIRIGPHDRPLPKPAFELTENKLDPKSAAKKPAARAKIRKIAKPGRVGVRKKTAAKSAALATKAGGATAHAARKAEAKKPALSAASPAIPKPSPAIAKQQGNTSAN
jgi:cell division protein FtsQ